METCYCCFKKIKKNETVDMGKHKACKTCVSLGGDSWPSIEIEAGSEEMSVIYEAAHKENVTLNMFVTRALYEFVETFEGLTKEEMEKKFKTEGIKISDAT